MLGVGGLAAVVPLLAHADDSWDDREKHHRRPVYQRRAFDWKPQQHRWPGRTHDAHWKAPQVSSGWFQRPYPYHLDYYKMRYGGSYAPYFGNLYGPPQVVTAPPYYGPYYGGFEPGNPQAHGPGGVVYESPVEESLPAKESPDAAGNGALPMLPP
jgi:hypothetical protein